MENKAIIDLLQWSRLVHRLAQVQAASGEARFDALRMLVQDLRDGLVEARRKSFEDLFPVEDREEVDLRQSAFGLLCGILDEYLRENVLADSEILMARREFYLNQFEDVYTGWDPKNLRETRYSWDRVIQGKQGFGFLPRFLAFSLLPYVEEGDLKASAPFLLTLLILDTVLHPRYWLEQVRKTTDPVEISSETVRDMLFIDDVAFRLVDLWGGAIKRFANIELHLTQDVLWSVRQGARVLVFSCAKTIYDQGGHDQGLPLFPAGEIPSEPSHLVVIPILDLGGSNDPLHSNLWMQFNKIAFSDERTGLYSGIRAARPRLPVRMPVQEQGSVYKEAWGTILDELERRVEHVTTVGIQAGGVFTDLRVARARMDLPLFEFEWQVDNLASLTAEFVRSLREAVQTGTLVFLVGPYGTAKTTISQHLFASIVHDTSAQPWDWFLLTYKPETETFSFEWVGKEQVFDTFRKGELSRLLSPDMPHKIVYNLPFGKNVAINLSELNAASPSTIRTLLGEIEALIREIKEKLLPERLLIFVSLQMYQLARELKGFFESRPDLTMGRARLDTAWLIRGDVAQRSVEVRWDSKREYLRSLVRFLLQGGEGAGVYADELIDRAFMPGDKKARAYYFKIHDLWGKDLEEGKVGRSARSFSRLEYYLTKVEGVGGQYLRQWNLSGEVGLDRGVEIFKLGLGTYATTSLSLLNGFIRQVIDILRNEMALDVAEYREIKRLSGGNRHAMNEIRVRSRIYDALASLDERSKYFFLTEHNLYERLEEKADRLRLERMTSEISSAIREILQSDMACTITGQIFCSEGGQTFDMGYVRRLVKKGKLATERFFYLLDVNTGGRQQPYEKARPMAPRLRISWNSAAGENSSTPLEGLKELLTLVRDLTAPFLSSQTSRPSSEALRSVERNGERWGAFTVDFTVDPHDPNRVIACKVTIPITNEAGSSTESVKQHLQDQIRQIRTLIARRESLDDVDLDRLSGDHDPLEGVWKVEFVRGQEGATNYTSTSLVETEDIVRDAYAEQLAEELRLTFRWLDPDRGFITAVNKDLFQDDTPHQRISDPEVVRRVLDEVQSGRTYRGKFIRRIWELLQYGGPWDVLPPLDALTEADFPEVHALARDLYFLGVYLNNGRVFRRVKEKDLVSEEELRQRLTNLPFGIIPDRWRNWAEAKIQHYRSDEQEERFERLKRLLPETNSTERLVAA